MKFLFWIFCFFLISGDGLAQAADTQFQDLIAQLQSSPDNTELRKQIIQLVNSMSVKPQTPDDLEEDLGRAKAAENDGNYPEAIEDLQKSSLLAPWKGDIYYNLGLILVKAKKPQDAIGNFELYLLAKPHAKNKKEVNEMIGEQQYVLEKMQGEMVLIPAGTFMMGTPDGQGSTDEYPHQVTLSTFYLNKYLVTFDQYDKFCDATGRPKPDDQGWGRGSRPVINVNWDDANAFAKWAGCRLPTEAEYEYAVRGGTTTQYFWGDDQSQAGNYAWYDDNSRNGTQPVGQKQPNPYGLYDIVGNVYEWCSDWYDENYYQNSPNQNPQGPTSGQFRVQRGGTWIYDLVYLRSASRYSSHPGAGVRYVGFRCAKTP